MNFAAAVQSGFRKFANFKGRASRPEYWWWFLFNFIVVGAISLTFGDNAGNGASLVLLLPSIAVGVRRLHDINRRGWWILVPLVNVFFFVQPSDAEFNRFGPPPPPVTLS